MLGPALVYFASWYVFGLIGCAAPQMGRSNSEGSSAGADVEV